MKVPAIDLRCGRWQDVMADVEVDASIFDGPYSDKTQRGSNSKRQGDDAKRADISYTHLTPKDVRLFVEHWHERTRGWIVSITDDILAPVWRAALRRVGRLDFAPIPLIMPGMTVRQRGDGPSCWAVWMVIAARPRSAEFASWGTLPGFYHATRTQEMRDTGAEAGQNKSPEWMQAIIRDYSKPGDLVGDQFGGLFRTAQACRVLGRRCISAEVNRGTFNKGVRLLALPHAPDLLTYAEVHNPPLKPPTPEQVSLFGGQK